MDQNLKTSTNDNTHIGLQNFIRTNATQLVTLGVLILLCIGMSFLSSAFLTTRNLINIPLQACLVGIMAVGMSFVIFSGGIDLSVGSILALCVTILGDLVVNRGVPALLAVIICLVIGTGCGALSGVLITKVNMPPFIVTMGAMQLWRGVALEWVDGVAIYGVPESIGFLGSSYLGNPKTNDFAIPYAVLLLIVLYGVAYFILKKTSFGMHTYAIGDNEKASQLSGIKVHKSKIYIYAISGLTCAIAAIVAMGRMNGANPLIGQSYELEAIAGVAIGGASMSGGIGNIWGTLIGVLIVQVIRNGMNILALSPYYQQMIIGIIIIISVGIDCFRRRKVN